MVERKDPPMSSDKGEDPYVAVPSQTQPEANGKPWNTTVSRRTGPLSPVAREGRGGGREGRGRGGVCVIEIYGCLAASS